MKINADLVKKLRSEKNWSQEQLSEMCGLNLRTIQRLENTGKASIESVNAVAAAFNIDPSQLIVVEKGQADWTPVDVIKSCFSNFSDFYGTASRYEYGCFLIFTLILLAIASVVHDKAGQIMSLLLMMPFLAVGARRLHDTGRSGWWQLFFLAPFGFIVVFCFMALPSIGSQAQLDTEKLDLA